MEHLGDTLNLCLNTNRYTPMTKKNYIIEGSKAIRGIERAEYFASGGTLVGWRGVKTITKDRKKHASKTKCRVRIKV